MKTCQYLPGMLSQWLRVATFLATLMVAFYVQNARAAIPAAAISDPRYALGYLVVTHYNNYNGYVVDPSGSLDSFAGIQAALEDAYENDLVLLFPSGTYRISDTLKCRQWRHTIYSFEKDCGGTAAKEGANPYKNKSYKIVGAHGGERPVIKLVPVTQEQQDAFNLGTKPPRPMLLLRLYQATTYPSTSTWQEPADIMGTPSGWIMDTAALFGCELRNINFDCNGQSRAIGVAWPGAQGGVVESVKVTATGAHAGFYGLPGRNWGAINIEVEGGDYGIRSGFGAGGNAVGQMVVAGLNLTGVTLTDQKLQAISYSDFAPLTLVGFRIKKNIGTSGGIESPLVLIDSTNTANNTMSLLDGSIELTNFGTSNGIAAITNPGKGLYLRNVYVKGTTVQVGSPSGNRVSGGSSGQWNRINEYVYNDVRGSTGADNDFFSQSADPCAAVNYVSFATRSAIDGTVGSTAEPITTGVKTNNSNPPADLLERHLPAGGFPYYDNPSTSPAALVVTNLPTSVYPVSATEDTSAASADVNREAIQAAINYAAGAGYSTYQGRVFIPKGVFQIRPANMANGGSGQVALTLTARTKLFGVAKWSMAVLAAHTSWRPTSANGVFIQTEDSDTATTYLGSLDMRLLGGETGHNLYLNPFTFLHWRAGPASMTHDLMGRCEKFLDDSIPVGTAPFVCSVYSGNAGGRHYFAPLWEQLFASGDTRSSRVGSYRSARIEGTSLPLWFYGFNHEGGIRDARDTDVEIKNSSNVIMLGFKHEGAATMLRIDNSSNVMVLGAGSMVNSAVSRADGTTPVAYIDVVNSSSNQLLMANVLIKSLREEAAGYTLEEGFSGGASVLYPYGVSVYKRGVFSYSAASPTTRVAYFTSIGADDGYVVGTTVGTGMNATGGGYQALRVGDDKSTNQYKSILSFDTSSLGSSAVVTDAELSLLAGGIRGNFANWSTQTFVADIKSGTIGAQSLEWADFSAAITQSAVASFTAPATTPTYLKEHIASSALGSINTTGLTQFRLYFVQHDDGDGADDYLGIHGGNDPLPENWPYLRVLYRQP